MTRYSMLRQRVARSKDLGLDRVNSVSMELAKVRGNHVTTEPFYVAIEFGQD